MIVIHNIEEMFKFYVSLGGKREATANGFFYRFHDSGSYIRFWGNLRGFSAASADFIYPEDIVIRTQLTERYLGVGFSESGSIQTYQNKKQTRRFDGGGDRQIYYSPLSLFLCSKRGERPSLSPFFFSGRIF